MAVVAKARAAEEVQRAKDEEKRDKQRMKEEEEALKRAEIDNSKNLEPAEPITPANNHDPNVVCVSFNEEVSEDWCYAACLGGICPPDAATDCMCSKGAEKPEQQSSEHVSTRGVTPTGRPSAASGSRRHGSWRQRLAVARTAALRQTSGRAPRT